MYKLSYIVLTSSVVQVTQCHSILERHAPLTAFYRWLCKTFLTKSFKRSRKLFALCLLGVNFKVFNRKAFVYVFQWKVTFISLVSREIWMRQANIARNSVISESSSCRSSSNFNINFSYDTFDCPVRLRVNISGEANSGFVCGTTQLLKKFHWV